MADNDIIVLEDAKDALFLLEKEFRRALVKRDLNAATAIKKDLDAAVDALGRARLKLLEEGVLATDDDVAEMRRIKAEMDQAADRQQLLEGAVKFAAFIGKFFV
ncbi:hypothetical protein AAFN88_17520 [Pelagibius sp. CAU 1746]|uniref:hypothetical protein n=1 Tax=Pelagibius sp. CAU 1746 TaxID=3140370 RepID=UPI00325C246D